MNRKSIIIASLLFLVLLSCKKKKEDVDIDGDVNKFDGRYTITGTIVDRGDPRIGSPGPKEYQMKTLNSTEIEMFSQDLGINGQIHANLSNLSYYAKFSVVVKFDPATNKIVSVRNGYGQPSENGRSAVLDPSGENSWNPTTKNIKIKYWMDQTGVMGHKASFDETWTYIGPR